MKQLSKLFALPLALTLFLTAAPAAMAGGFGIEKTDDTVAFNLEAESWVTTKTAKVVVGVEAAVTATSSGATRSAMMKAVNDAIKAEWRLVNFNRSQDATGMERWSAQYEARVPETDLSGLPDTLKKLSKAGMQLSVQDIQFTPTLEETQAVETQLRTQIYKMANEQLAALNAAIPGRNFRISEINFTRNGGGRPPMMQMARAMAMKAGAYANADMESAPEPMERAQKLAVSAHIELAAQITK